jgi:hypothetical protein
MSFVEIPARPRPAVRLTLSRNARLILLGSGTPPSHRCRPAVRRPLESKFAPGAAADPPDAYHGCDSPRTQPQARLDHDRTIPSTPPCCALSPGFRRPAHGLKRAVLARRWPDAPVDTACLRGRAMKHRAFIQSIGLHNRLHLAFKCQKSDDNDHQVRCVRNPSNMVPQRVLKVCLHSLQR